MTNVLWLTIIHEYVPFEAYSPNIIEPAICGTWQCFIRGGIQNSPEPCLYIHIGGYTASCAAMSYPDIGAVVSILTSHCVLVCL